MANLRIIKRRIKSIGGIRQITRAMEMVSATNLRKALSRVENARPYFEGMDQIIAHLMASLEPEETSELSHPLMKIGREGGDILLVVIGSDKGLCGSYNSNIIKKALLTIESELHESSAFRFTPSGGDLDAILTKPDKQTVNFKGFVDSKGVVKSNDRTELVITEAGNYSIEYAYKPQDGSPISGSVEFHLGVDSSGSVLTHFWSYKEGLNLPYSGTLKLNNILTDLNVTGKVVYVLPVGKRIYKRFLKEKNPRVRMITPELNFNQNLPVSELNRMTDVLTKPYIDENVSSVLLLYTQYLSAARQKPIVEQFLPLGNVSEEEQESIRESREYIFSPSADDLFKNLIPAYARNKVFQAFAHAFTSEHSIRMVSMRNATDNAGELIDSLTLQRNKARQSAITKELSEIVGGAEALKG